jgi:GntR family transcriptional regulator/MocR family aminotransferase
LASFLSRNANSAKEVALSIFPWASSEARVVPVPVDAEGINVVAGSKLAPNVKLICVAPSHQYPLGVTMSLARRLELLEWTREREAWIFEDDYDSEFRYEGRPLAALQGLDSEGRVVYVGTFSKILGPALRLAYIVVPPDLVDAFIYCEGTAGPPFRAF